MQDDQIKLVENILISFGKKKIDVAEWGAGGSTVYFPGFLKRMGINYFWMAMEHNKEWAEKIQKATAGDKQIRVHLFEQKTDSPQSINLDQYVTFPRVCCDLAKKKFDFILIDGRARARCLVEAKFCINPGGIILLHDAEREKYHYVFPLFEKGKMVKSVVEPHAVWLAGDFERIFTKNMKK